MLSSILRKLLPGVKISDNAKPSAPFQDSANLKNKDKFSPMEIKMVASAIELDSSTTTQPFNISIMDKRTLPSRFKFMK